MFRPEKQTFDLGKAVVVFAFFSAIFVLLALTTQTISFLLLIAGTITLFCMAHESGRTGIVGRETKTLAMTVVMILLVVFPLDISFAKKGFFSVSIQTSSAELQRVQATRSPFIKYLLLVTIP